MMNCGNDLLSPSITLVYLVDSANTRIQIVVNYVKSRYYTSNAC